MAVTANRQSTNLINNRKSHDFSEMGEDCIIKLLINLKLQNFSSKCPTLALHFKQKIKNSLTSSHEQSKGSLDICSEILFSFFLLSVFDLYIPFPAQFPIVFHGSGFRSNTQIPNVVFQDFWYLQQFLARNHTLVWRSPFAFEKPYHDFQQWQRGYNLWLCNASYFFNAFFGGSSFVVFDWPSAPSIH